LIFRNLGLAKMRSTETDERDLFTGRAQFAIEHLALQGSRVRDARNARGRLFRSRFRNNGFARAGLGGLVGKRWL